MSVKKSFKQMLLLGTLAAVTAGAYLVTLDRSAPTSTADETKQVVSERPEKQPPAQTALVDADQVASYSDGCTDCLAPAEPAPELTSKDAQPHLSTSPELDYVFKTFASQSDHAVPVQHFGFLQGSSVGQNVSFELGGLDYQGTVSFVQEHERASSYAVALNDGLGRLIYAIDGNRQVKVFVQFSGDRRILHGKSQTVEGRGEMLVFEEKRFEDFYGGVNAKQSATLKYVTGGESPEPGTFTIEAHNSLFGAEHVIYLDFDGEDVSSIFWLGGDLIEALAHPRADEPDFVANVWSRVAEDFAPFNINVTTDRTVYNNAAVDQRLHIVMTPTRDWIAQNDGISLEEARTFIGVGLTGIYRFNSAVAWVFAEEEYLAASTASHEAGHAFGLSHDTQVAEVYYEGHSTPAYAPGWAPIMGAPEFDEFYDEVYQWSKGEFTDSANDEDDITIIAGSTNGFGLRADQIADFIGDSQAYGDVSVVGDGLLAGTGLIEAQTDVDVFRFRINEGRMGIVVSPLDIQSVLTDPGSSTSGANLAVDLELWRENDDDSLELIAEGVDFGDNLLSSEIDVTVPAGTYYLFVDGGGRGTDGTDGFTDYGSLGEYTVLAQVPLPPLTVFGGSKQTVAVFDGDTTVQLANGTDFGFVAQSGEVQNTFLLDNQGALLDIVVTSITFASGQNFRVGPLDPSGATITPAALGAELDIIYDPTSSGVHQDTVTITFDAGGEQTFEFAIEGTATSSANKDNYEDNNTALAAENLNGIEDVWLSAYKGLAFFKSDQHDWYTFTVEPDDGLLELETLYNTSLGNITFEVRNYIGTVIYSSSAGVGDFLYRIPENYSGNQRKFYIYVTTSDNASVLNPYNLKWQAFPLVVGDDDFYEENDTAGEAENLTNNLGTPLSDLLGEGISKDEDWYEVTISADPFARMLYVEATFDHSEGDINIEVYDPNNVIYTSDSTDDREVLTVVYGVSTEDYADSWSPSGNTAIMGVIPGTYRIRVYGDFNGNSYDLLVDTPRDDQYEIVDNFGTENDTLATAFPLGDEIIEKFLFEIDGFGTGSAYAENATAQNFNHGADADWYSVTIDPSETISEITLFYSSFLGDGAGTTFAIYNVSGQELANSNRDGQNDSGSLLYDRMTINYTGGNTFYILVVPTDDISSLSGYDFRVDYSTEPNLEVDPEEDNYEENDNFLELYDIRDNEGRYLSSLDGYGLQLDADWYEIFVPENASRVVATLIHVAADGNMDLSFSNKEGPTRFVSNGSGNTETITWDDPEAGEYALTVTGENRGNFYNLFWDLTFEEDNYEENDTIVDAFDITGFERRFLSKLDGTGIQKDDDWYRIEARADTSELRAELFFTHAQGDIDLALYNAAGSLIARSITSTNNESLVYPNPPVGDYYLRAYFSNEGNEYDLTWSALTAAEVSEIGSKPDDVYEQNDSISNAYELTAELPRLSRDQGLAVLIDDDWYEIEIPVGNTGLRVECLFDDADGDIDFEIYDPLGFPLFVRDSNTDNEILDVRTNVPAGVYNIRVYGPNLANDYDLYWRAFIEDIYEENDDSSEAYDITSELSVPLSNVGVPTLGDDDWFVFEVTGDRPSIIVDLAYLDEDGAINFDILDSSLNVLATGSPRDETNNSDFAQVRDVPLGTYYVHVYGDFFYNPYDLTVTVTGDDQYEENDTSAAAADITDEPLITAVQFDDDWYKFTVTDANTFLSIIATFTDANGNIDLEVYEASDLINPIGTSANVDVDNETVRVAGEVGEYYIRVFGDDVNASYQLLWTVSPDDEFEQNDVIEDAFDLTDAPDVPIDAIQFDEDWFEIEAAPGNIRILVDLEFEHAAGDLNLTLFNAVGEEVASVDSGDDNEAIAHPIFPFGTGNETFFVRVSGTNVGTPYQLTWALSQEDNFEDSTGNNTIDNASQILLDNEGVRISSTIGYGGAVNDDWYEVSVNGGDDGLVIEAFFRHADGNIDLELFTIAGAFVTRSVGESDVERIQIRGSGRYVLRVYGASASNPYDLIWNSYNEDNLEDGVRFDPTPSNPPDNDTQNTPRGLYGLSINQSTRGIRDLEFVLLDEITQLDEDWYVFNVQPGEDIFTLDINFEHDQGDIDVALYREVSEAPPVLLAQSESEGDNERIEASNLTPGSYLICVYGYGILSPKSLPGWVPGASDPSTGVWVPGTYEPSGDAEFSTIVENTDPDFDFYDLADAHARGLGNTYTMQWISSFEDQYDESNNSNASEVNDSLENSAVPILIDQYGIVDPVIVDTERTASETNDEGDSQLLTYRPVYGFNNLAQFDEDWFEFTVDTGGQHDFYASIIFNTRHGNLDLFVYNEEGALIDSSTSETSFAESVDVAGTGETTYYIQVTGNDLGVPYDLSVRGFLDDVYEDNEDLEQADANADLTSLAGSATAEIFVQRDVDIYRVEIPDNQVHLQFSVLSNIESDTGNGIRFDLAILDSEGNQLPAAFDQVGLSTSTLDNVTRGVISPEGGVYYLRVSGNDSAGLSYGILWDYNNVDEYDDVFPYTTLNANNDPQLIVSNNNSPLFATELTRLRLEPPYSPTALYLDSPRAGNRGPIQEFAFDENYSLVGSINLAIDPFGHATQEADDWYVIQIPSWFRAAAEEPNPRRILKRLYYTRMSAEIAFEHVEGDINMEIYSGVNEFSLDLLGRSETNNDTESLTVAIDPTDEDLFYFIRVYGDNAGNDYSLKWNHTREDSYERLEDVDSADDYNSFVDRAFDLTNADGVSTEGIWLHDIAYLQDVNGDNQINGSDGGVTSRLGYGLQGSPDRVPSDNNNETVQETDDWYTVVVSPGATQIEVECVFYSDNDTNYPFTPDNLDIDFEVYFLSGNDGDPNTLDLRKPVLVGRSTQDTNDGLFVGTGATETQLTEDITTPITEGDGPVRFDVDEPGIYFIRVYYDNRGHPYTFRWDDIGDADGSDDSDVIFDYLNGNWSFDIPDDLLPALLQLPYSNIDGDRWPNWAEFALGLNGSVADYAVLGQTLVEIEGKQYYQFEFLRNKDAENFGYVFIVEETDDMIFDGTEAVFIGTEEVDGNDELERVFYRCSKPLDEQDKCFFRLTVQEPDIKD